MRADDLENGQSTVCAASIKTWWMMMREVFIMGDAALRLFAPLPRVEALQASRNITRMK